MEGRRGRGRGRRTRLLHNIGGDRESTAEQNQGAGVNIVEQMATAMNRMTEILDHMAGQQGPGPEQHLGNLGVGEDRALERFQRFNPPKFYGGSDPEVAEGWMEMISDIFNA